MGRGESNEQLLEEVERTGFDGTFPDLSDTYASRKLVGAAVQLDVLRRTDPDQSRAIDAVREIAATAAARRLLRDEKLSPSAKKFLAALTRFVLLASSDQGETLLPLYQRAIVVGGVESFFTSYLVRSSDGEVHVIRRADIGVTLCGARITEKDLQLCLWQKRLPRGALKSARHPCYTCQAKAKQLPVTDPAFTAATEGNNYATTIPDQAGLDLQRQLVNSLAERLRGTEDAEAFADALFDAERLNEEATAALTDYIVGRFEQIEWAVLFAQLWEFELLPDDNAETPDLFGLQDRIVERYGATPPQPSESDLRAALNEGIACGVRIGRYVFLRKLAELAWPDAL